MSGDGLRPVINWQYYSLGASTTESIWKPHGPDQIHRGSDNPKPLRAAIQHLSTRPVLQRLGSHPHGTSPGRLLWQIRSHQPRAKAGTTSPSRMVPRQSRMQPRVSYNLPRDTPKSVSVNPLSTSPKILPTREHDLAKTPTISSAGPELPDVQLAQLKTDV